ncbi:tRNA (adenine-N(1)-)-methyltransferase non-catalytic subunit [Capronia coronata CBS 617.96]|uniref:tRNA (adenine(58)-N(1))-methyltransferase non-catalytic subunit TRM6 n=1 Tax=Capronia coronata CBS 617.96 TaxID=1182541 RepID=W9YWE5_9EURO|nr:tRNA (adenine-N(1)-)-methyltransferase non-catalytic subunit [Capronia coronata CBS 617.96]EXJ93990.1 tRNA (adenine-N(1)-)-methyltransferase non-catalytic subunit [Capronia coronata CBS 617.96]
MAFATIQPFQFVALRLPSESIRVEQIIPNSQINLGKYGSFRTNQIIGRPYNLTFELLDRSEVQDGRELRIVSAAELHALALVEQAETEDAATPQTDLEDSGARSTPKSNVNTHDDPTNQKLTMAEIEALKQDDLGSGKALIEKIMQSHSTLDQKTAFSLAKYTLRKHKKYLKRFSVLPLDVSILVDWMMSDREFARIMEMRNEAVALVGCWANIHASGHDYLSPPNEPSSRYLVVDDTGGLIVAAVAERMGILHQKDLEEGVSKTREEDADEQPEQPEAVLPHKDRRRHYRQSLMSAPSNSITMVHANQQPNLGLLRYFNFDANNPTPSHPLYTSLKSLSWLQLLEPESDITYQEPEIIPPEELAKAKSNRRSAYFRKRRRWERVKTVVDETRAGGFDGLIVASYTDSVSILRPLVPLLAGGSQVVVYSPNVEPLVELADLYSTARKTAFINTPQEERRVPSEDFPVDPTLLLAPTVQTARVRQWQVLPGRTHPLMTSKGGAEGYIFVATRVLPAEGKVAARGRPGRAKKTRAEESTKVPATATDGELSQSPLKKQKIEAEEAFSAQPTLASLRVEPTVEPMIVEQNGES